MLSATGYAAGNSTSRLAPFNFDRKEPGPHDVVIEIDFCGVCHSDIHTVRGEWGETFFPLVPGHEIVGRVTRVGDKVVRYAPGDTVGVGCLVDSCRGCASCGENLEQYCEAGPTWTYGSVDRSTGQVTQGGYSNVVVVDEHFVLKMPKGLDPAAAAPLLCAGITTYSPLRHWKVTAGQTVGVAGLGGLGHMAVKMAHAMGARVVVFTSSQSKVADAKRLGADEVVVTKNHSAMQEHKGTLDLLIDSVSAAHALDEYASLVKRDKSLVLLGVPATPHPPLGVHALIVGRRSIAGSLIGGIKETQEMLNFAAEKKVVSDVEVIPIQKINEAYERMMHGDVRYRFVIDMASLR